MIILGVFIINKLTKILIQWIGHVAIGLRHGSTVLLEGLKWSYYRVIDGLLWTRNALNVYRGKELH